MNRFTYKYELDEKHETLERSVKLRYLIAVYLTSACISQECLFVWMLYEMTYYLARSHVHCWPDRLDGRSRRCTVGYSKCVGHHTHPMFVAVVTGLTNKHATDFTPCSYYYDSNIHYRCLTNHQTDETRGVHLSSQQLCTFCIQEINWPEIILFTDKT